MRCRSTTDSCISHSSLVALTSRRYSLETSHCRGGGADAIGRGPSIWSTVILSALLAFLPPVKDYEMPVSCSALFAASYGNFHGRGVAVWGQEAAITAFISVTREGRL